MKKTLLTILITTLVVCPLTAVAVVSYSAKDIEYKNGKTVENALDELYEKSDNLFGVVANFSIIRNGAYADFSNLELKERNEEYTEIINDSLYVTQEGEYAAYLTVAHGQENGFNGAWNYLYINDENVETAYFDRVYKNVTGQKKYIFKVEKGQKVKVESKIKGQSNYASAAQTATTLIVRIK